MAEINIADIDLSEWDLVKRDSGEVIPSEVLGKSSNGFSKHFDLDFFERSRTIESQPVLALWGWILSNRDSYNLVTCRKAEISSEVGCSANYVTKLIKSLKDSDLIRSYSRGVYMIDPNISYTGGFAKQTILKERWKALGKG
ncbi:hypothetical protein DMW20_11985 [Vibrio parahaemolyticus]|nr:hypothetical protein [Vibrio parahaemolyticus]